MFFVNKIKFFQIFRQVCRKEIYCACKNIMHKFMNTKTMLITFPDIMRKSIDSAFFSEMSHGVKHFSIFSELSLQNCENII